VNLENLNDNPPQFVDNQVEISSVVVTAPEEVTPPLIIYTFDVWMAPTNNAIKIIIFTLRFWIWMETSMSTCLKL
jgi:hypothetical protein